MTLWCTLCGLDIPIFYNCQYSVHFSSIFVVAILKCNILQLKIEGSLSLPCTCGIYWERMSSRLKMNVSRVFLWIAESRAWVNEDVGIFQYGKSSECHDWRCNGMECNISFEMKVFITLGAFVCCLQGDHLLVWFGIGTENLLTRVTITKMELWRMTWRYRYWQGLT